MQGNLSNVPTSFAGTMSLSSWASNIQRLIAFYGAHANFTIATNANLILEISDVPVNVVVPTITGTTTEGQTLTYHTGTWFGQPTFTKQWYRDGVAIAAATGSTYVLVTADATKAITVKETGTNHWGSSTATSAATAAITGL